MPPNFLPTILAPSATITDAPEYGLSTPVTIRRVTPRIGREWAMHKNQAPAIREIEQRLERIEQLLVP